MNHAPRLICTYFTLAGNIHPFDDNTVSPVSLPERARAAAAAGYVGFGFNVQDITHLLASLGTRQVNAILDDCGLARDKASTSARLPLATSKLAEMAEARPGIEFMRGVTTLPGGLPIFDSDGAHLGGVGASGGSADQDVNCARAGLDALEGILDRGQP